MFLFKNFLKRFYLIIWQIEREQTGGAEGEGA